jgi:hypothetical protein
MAVQIRLGPKFYCVRASTYVILMFECASHAVARLAQLVERKTLNLVVVGSSPTMGVFPVYRRYQNLFRHF